MPTDPMFLGALGFLGLSLVLVLVVLAGVLGVSVEVERGER